jgi:hypothetical protein
MWEYNAKTKGNSMNECPTKNHMEFVKEQRSISQHNTVVVELCGNIMQKQKGIQ